MQDVQVRTGIVLEGLDEKEAVMIEVSELSGHSFDDMNSFEEPERIVPANKTLHLQGNQFEYEIPRHSLTVMRVKRSQNDTNV